MEDVGVQGDLVTIMVLGGRGVGKDQIILDLTQPVLSPPSLTASPPTSYKLQCTEFDVFH